MELIPMALLSSSAAPALLHSQVSLVHPLQNHHSWLSSWWRTEQMMMDPAPGGLSLHHLPGISRRPNKWSCDVHCRQTLLLGAPDCFLILIPRNGKSFTSPCALPALGRKCQTESSWGRVPSGVETAHPPGQKAIPVVWKR